ncbi:hypothetical protein ACEPAH_1259 [Sanghuangporus vaninii]
MPQPDSEDIFALTLSPDNPSNTTITNPAGDILYTAETLFPRGKESSYAITHVCGNKGQTIAALEWKDISSDLVGLGEEAVELDAEGDAVGLKKGKEIKLTQWMKSSIVPFDTSVSFRDEKGKKYKWKGYGTGETLELHTSDYSSGPIAQFRPSRARADPPRPAQLLLAPRAQGIMDIVVTSFLFLEKNRRATDSSTQNKADVLGTPYMNLPGGGKLRTQVVHKGGA